MTQPPFASTFRITSEIKAQNSYWIKDQQYSIYHIMNGDPIAEFVGDTIYQGYMEQVIIVGMRPLQVQLPSA